jgi:hypothetical protein
MKYHLKRVEITKVGNLICIIYIIKNSLQFRYNFITADIIKNFFGKNLIEQTKNKYLK